MHNIYLLILKVHYLYIIVSHQWICKIVNQNYKGGALCNCADNYEQKDIINGSITLSIDSVT